MPSEASWSMNNLSWRYHQARVMAKDAYLTGREKAVAFNSRLDRSYLGKSLKIGTKESLGWFYGKSFGVNNVKPQGFLGMSGTFREMGVPTVARNRLTYLAQTQGTRGVGKFAASTAFKSLGPLFTAGFVYSGYREHGVLGAVGGLVESAAWSAGIRAVGGLMNPITLGVAGAAAVGYGAYALGEAGKEHSRKLRQIEFGTNNLDGIGSVGAATSRQRAVMALQNTHLNGRMALGNEAILMHS